ALARKTKGDYWVLHAPAIVSSDETQMSLMNEPQIQKVMTIVKKIDIALVGIEDVSERATFFKSTNMTTDDLAHMTQEGAVASIGTSFIDRHGHEVADHYANRMI